MRNLYCLPFFLLLLTALSDDVWAQDASPAIAIPKGKTLYSLPQTVLVVRAEAVRESFVAGPYARYAKRMLGVEAQSKNSESVSLTEVEVQPFIEPGNRRDLFVDIGRAEREGVNFLKMTECGLIIFTDTYKETDSKMRFPLNRDTLFNRVRELSNFEERSTTLYRILEKPEGNVKMAMTQSRVVEKESESKAADMAELIKKLRARRIDLVTGDTEVQYSGEALKVLLAEIDKMEADYLSMFIGKVQRDTQKIAVEILPSVSDTVAGRSLYVAFRVSESQGLLQPDNLSGRPVMMEMIMDRATDMRDSSGEAKIEVPKGSLLYRKPAMVRVRLIDTGKLLIDTRIPIYQMGDLLTFPLR